MADPLLTWKCWGVGPGVLESFLPAPCHPPVPGLSPQGHHFCVPSKPVSPRPLALAGQSVLTSVMKQRNGSNLCSGAETQGLLPGQAVPTAPRVSADLSYFTEHVLCYSKNHSNEFLSSWNF